MAFGIDDAIGAVAGLFTSAVDRIWPDATQVEKDKLTQFQAELTAKMAPILGQLDINKTEAASPSLFVAGWRPFIGWVCGAGFAYDFLVQPLLTPLMGVVSHFAGFPVVLPTLDGSTLMGLTTGMLGLAGARTYEYMQGTARQNMQHNPNTHS